MGSVGSGKALNEFGLAVKTVFIGHELNVNSRMFLETGVMNFAIGHDVANEVELELSCAIQAAGRKALRPPAFMRILIYAKHNRNLSAAFGNIDCLSHGKKFHGN